MKKVILNDKMFNLISQEEYFKDRNYYDTESNVAIELDMNIALPLTQSKYNTGVYSDPNCPIIRYNMPTSEDMELYTLDENNVIDFSNLSNTANYYENCIKYNDAEREIITTTTNQFKPKIKESDSPLLKLVKQTVCDKNIDIDKYADRFEQFNNDKRLLSPSYTDITMKKSVEMLSNLDVDVYTITMNKEGDIPNPMPNPLIRKITGNGEELSIEELTDILKGEK